ncbi:glutamine amidotransferase class-I [Aureococcus anophagefferens]|nr:glutamine amidotransferase class-I [Aureococcus anophagefferens]
MMRAATLRRSLSTTAKTLRVVVVDGYAQKSRDDDDYVPPSDDALAAFDAAAFTGSSYSAYAPDVDVARQVDLMRRTFDCGVSSFGSCWGIQIAAVALGGRVELSPNGREVGFGRKVALTPEGRGHPMYAGKKSCFHAFMSHSDEVSVVPPGAVVTSGNDHSRVRPWPWRNGTESWFVQYHPEYDLAYYASLIAGRKERMTAMGFFRSEDDIDACVDDLTALHAAASRRADVAWKYGVDGTPATPTSASARSATGSSTSRA